MIFTGIYKYKDLGLLIIRFGLGLSFLWLHGWPKLEGGPARWERLGGAMANIGIDFAPQFWGFMAMFSEVAGGLMLILGLFFVPANLLISFTLIVASANHLANEDPWSKVVYPLELLAVTIGLMFTGPGKYSIDSMFKRDPIKMGNK